ncbi:ABC transporter permease [Enterococcus sp. LJL128]
MSIYFSGWLRLLRLNLRRDRWQIGCWLLGLAGLSITVAAAFPELFSTQEERQVMAETVKNPAMIAMIGPSESLDNYTLGAMFGHEMTLLMAIAAAIMMILLTARHTRGEEEDGRLEMIRVLPVGRLATLIAVFAEMVIISFFIAGTNGIGVGLLGIETMPMSASILYGAALAGAGLVFSAVTAVFAQLAETNRGTVGFSLGILGAAYLYRGFTDLSNKQLSWLSPLAWVYKTEVYVNNNWLPIVLSIVFALLVFGLAAYLNSIRDLEAGFIPQRAGRKHAGRFLKSRIGFSLSLMKTTLISWGVALLIAGASYGSFFGDLDSFFQSNEMLVMLLPKNSSYSLTEQFMTVLMVILAILSSIPVLSVGLKIYSEEKKGRLEQLFSKAITRYQLFGGYLIIAVVASVIMMGAAITGLYIASSSVMTTPIALNVMLQSGFAYLPAIWFVLGMGVCLIGFLPKWSSLIWAYLVFSFFVDYLGNMLNIPEWVNRISVFSYIPRIPVDSMDWFPLLIICGAAAVLTAVGLVGYRQRDIKG